MAPACGFSRRHRRRLVCAVGMGADVLDSRVFAAGIQLERGAGWSVYGQHSSHRRLDCDCRDGDDPFPAVYGQPPSRCVAPRGRHRAGDYPLHHRLLDPRSGCLQTDVLDFHPGDLLLHRPMFRVAQQSGSLLHAQHVHCGISSGGERVELDRGPFHGGSAERLVRRPARKRCGIPALRHAGARPQRILGRVSSMARFAHHHRGSEARDRLHQGLVALRLAGMGRTSMDRRWLPLNALRAFEGVAQHLSFTAAANALLISQSALSRHVIALEKLIGVQLFERRPHALVLTKAGQHLLTAVMKSFDRLEFALDDIRNDGASPMRTLRVQMPPTFAAHLAVPILRDFRRAAPDVEIDLVSPYGVGPPLNEVDVAVVYSKPTVTDLVRDLLWPVRQSVLCHPTVAERNKGKSLAEFIESNELIHVRLSDLPRHYLWTQFARQTGLNAVNVERGLVFDTALLAVQYALSGEGVALIDNYLFGDYIRSGRLIRPFENILDDGYGYYLITHPEGLGDTAIALFRSWLIERFGSASGAAPPSIHLAVSNE